MALKITIDGREVSHPLARAVLALLGAVVLFVVFAVVLFIALPLIWFAVLALLMLILGLLVLAPRLIQGFRAGRQRQDKLLESRPESAASGLERDDPGPDAGSG